jgi:hypothetical protein
MVIRNAKTNFRCVLLTGTRSAERALAVIRYAKIHGTDQPWIIRLLVRRPTKVAAIALANKIARMAWAMMARNERYNEPARRDDTRSHRTNGWETNSTNAAPVDPAVRSTHVGHSTFECVLMIGT